MNESTTEIDIVPLPTGYDVLTGVLRDEARRMLAHLRGWHHSTLWRKINSNSLITEFDALDNQRAVEMAECG